MHSKSEERVQMKSLKKKSINKIRLNTEPVIHSSLQKYNIKNTHKSNLFTIYSKQYLIHSNHFDSAIFNSNHKYHQTKNKLQSQILKSLNQKTSRKSNQSTPIKLLLNYQKFQQNFENLQKLKESKKYQDFCYKQKYYDIARRPLHETNLKLSSGSWLAFDYNKKKYIRGWKSGEVKEIKNLSKIFVVNCILRLLNEDKIESTSIRINKIENYKDYILQNNTKINLKEIIYGLMLTSSHELMQYIIINIGYYISLANSSDPFSYTNHLQLYLQNYQNIKQYKKIFLNQIQQLVHKLKLFHTQIQNQSQIKSSSFDLSILFNDSLQYPLFLEFLSTKKRVSSIKYQVGYHYWENRTIVWKNEYNWPDGFMGTIGFRGSGNSILVYNKRNQILIVVMDCSYFKAIQDVQSIVKWCLRELKLCKTNNYLEECRKTFSKQKKIFSNTSKYQ